MLLPQPESVVDVCPTLILRRWIPGAIEMAVRTATFRESPDTLKQSVAMRWTTAMEQTRSVHPDERLALHQRSP